METKQEEFDLEALQKQTEQYRESAAQGGGRASADYCKNGLYWAITASFGYQYASLPANSIVNTCASWGWIAKESMTSNGLFWAVNVLSITLLISTTRGYNSIVKNFMGSIFSGSFKKPESKSEAVLLVAGGYTVAVKALVSGNATFFNNVDVFSGIEQPIIPSAIITALTAGGSASCHGSLLLGQHVKRDAGSTNPNLEYHIKDVYDSMPEVAEFLLKNTNPSNKIVVGKGERWFGNTLTAGDALLSAFFYGNGAATMFEDWGVIDPETKYRAWPFYVVFFSVLLPVTPVNFFGKQQYVKKYTHRLLTADDGLSKKQKMKKCCGQLVGWGSGAKNVTFNTIGLLGAVIKFLASFTSFLRFGFGLSDQSWVRGLVWTIGVAMAFCALYMTVSVNNHQEKQTARMPFWSQTKDEELVVFKKHSAKETYPLIEVIEDDKKFQEEESRGMGYQSRENTDFL